MVPACEGLGSVVQDLLEDVGGEEERVEEVVCD
jgi:hypothetical protein